LEIHISSLRTDLTTRSTGGGSIGCARTMLLSTSRVAQIWRGTHMEPALPPLLSSQHSQPNKWTLRATWQTVRGVFCLSHRRGFTWSLTLQELVRSVVLLIGHVGRYKLNRHRFEHKYSLLVRSINLVTGRKFFLKW